MRQTRWGAVLAASLFVALPGCGDDDSSKSSAPEQQAAPKFIAELNRICEEGNRRADQLNDQLQEAADSDNFSKGAAILDREREAIESDRERFEELNVPAEDQAAFQRYAAQARLIQRLTGRLADATRDEDIDEINRLIALHQEARDRRTGAAVSLGADECRM